jgi:hypothetical protein
MKWLLNKKVVSIILFLFGAAMMVACGGGGGGGGGGSTTATHVPTVVNLGVQPTSNVLSNSKVEFTLFIDFTDAGGDIIGGNAYLSYNGITYPATLYCKVADPTCTDNVTSGSLVVIVKDVITYAKAGTYGMQVWISDRALNNSRKFDFSISQM